MTTATRTRPFGELTASPSSSCRWSVVVVVVGVVGVVSVVGVISTPTTIVTVEPMVPCLPPLGVCVRTTPSSAGSVVSRCCTTTWKPAERSVAVAVSWSRSVTSGTAVVVGPSETLSVTVDPFGAALFAEGAWSSDGLRRLVRLDVDAAHGEAEPLERRERVGVRPAEHVGHADRLRAGRDVDPDDGLGVDQLVGTRALGDHRPLGLVARDRVRVGL